MIVTHLQLGDFRNYATADVAFEPGANLVVGSNGQGKTNLVEAIGYLATMGSHRTSTDQALVRSGADAAIVRARLRHDGREVTVELQLNRQGANRAQLNGAPSKPRELTRYLSTVLFAPEDLALVRGEPSGRRRFLDQLLVQRSPRFAGVIADYDRVLRQRNGLLKSARAAARGGDLSTLEIWDERLVDLGSELIEARSALVDDLRPFVAEAYRSIAGGEHAADLGLLLSVLGAQPEETGAGDRDAEDAEHGALSAAAIAVSFAESLARLRRQELDRGLTLVGPHRDDLVLELNGLPARGYASHGESWSFALALRLAAAALLRRESSAGDPVVILDDVFAELDEARRDRLAAAVADYEQVIITAAVRRDVPPTLAGRTIWIRAGAQVDDPEAAS